MSHSHPQPDPLRPHAHDPNPEPPSTDPTFVFSDPFGNQQLVLLSNLKRLPQTSLPNCFIVSTGHGTSGPFTFTGVTLLNFIQSRLPAGTRWSQVEVVSADGFGNRVLAAELHHPQPADRPILLAYAMNGREMNRQQGLVRMIVPGETDDALRQVKWVGQIVVRGQHPLPSTKK